MCWKPASLVAPDVVDTSRVFVNCGSCQPLLLLQLVPGARALLPLLATVASEALSTWLHTAECHNLSTAKGYIRLTQAVPWGGWREEGGGEVAVLEALTKLNVFVSAGGRVVCM